MRDMKDSGVEWIGEVPVHWELSRIKNLFYIVGGNGFPEHLQGNETGDYPFCKVSDINGNSRFVSTAVNYVTEETVCANKFNVVPVGSILFAKIGAALQKNHRKINTVPCCIDNNTEALVPYSKELIGFYYYLLKTIDMNWFDNKSTIPSINNQKMLSFYVPIPPAHEQLQISNVLDKKCNQVDTLVSNVQAQIEKLKAYKQSLITEVVTKGLDPAVLMKDSGVEWLGKVPEHWGVYRVANLYSERSENGLPELPLLTVSINTGVSDHEVADKDKDRVFIRMEDRSKYKRVCPGDLTYNMMRAWQGAFGAVRVDGLVSPAYVVAKPKKDIPLDSRYIEALLRTPVAIEEMHRYSRGIVDFRLRLYWPEFKNICICLPPIDEQRKIADYIDEIAAKVDALVAIKQAKIEKLEQYKRSLIYEYVTGKREVV